MTLSSYGSTPIRRKRTYSLWNKINPGFAVDLSNYAGKDLPQLHIGDSLRFPATTTFGRAPTFGRVGLYHAAKDGRVTKPPSASRPFG